MPVKVVVASQYPDACSSLRASVSVPESVSTLRAVADAGTQALIGNICG